MIFDPNISGLSYAPDDEIEDNVQDDYPEEDEDMEKYYEDKYEKNESN